MDWQEMQQFSGRTLQDSALAEPVMVDGRSMRGLFESNASIETVDPSTGMTVEDRVPMVSVRSADMAGRPRHGISVIARGVRYAVMSVQPNSDGDWSLFLEFADDDEDGSTDGSYSP